MKNAISLIYLIMGFLVGFVVGATQQKAMGFPLERLGYFLIAIIVIILYVWFENTSHDRHISKWESHRRRGKLYFILSHYIVARAIPILLIFNLPLSSLVNLTSESIHVLILTAFIAIVVFILLGYQEWSRCQTEFSVKLLRDAAQHAKETRSDPPGGGV